jgi:Pentapeptide repeats (8 copies)
MAQEAAEKPDATAPETDAKPWLATDIQAALSVLGRLPQQPYVSRGDLTGAQVAGAQLVVANLSGAQLAGANLRQAQALTQPQLDVSLGDARTQLPAGLERPANWPASWAPAEPPTPPPLHALPYDRIMPAILL